MQFEYKTTIDQRSGSLQLNQANHKTLWAVKYRRHGNSWTSVNVTTSLDLNDTVRLLFSLEFFYPGKREGVGTFLEKYRCAVRGFEIVTFAKEKL